MHRNIKISLASLLVFIASISAAVAAGPPSPPATPIDGGLSLLLAGGATYGIHKIRQARKHKQ